MIYLDISSSFDRCPAAVCVQLFVFRLKPFLRHFIAIFAIVTVVCCKQSLLGTFYSQDVLLISSPDPKWSISSS